MPTAVSFSGPQERFDAVLLFRALSAEARQLLFERSDQQSFEPNEVLVHEGDTSPCFYAILEGAVAVEVRQDGRDVYICTLGRGEVFGEASLFLKSPRTASVRALDPTSVIRIDRDVWMDFLRRFPREGNKALLAIVHGLLSKLRSANQELAFERRSDSAQDEIDALVAELAGHAP